MSADSDHVEFLRRGPRPWNEWRSENPSVIPNLVGIALSIGDRQLGPINGGPIDLAHARLRHASLRFATLTRANLQGADLADTDLRDARLEMANLAGAVLCGAALERADLMDADLTGADLRGANLSGARNLTSAQLHGAEGDVSTILPDDVEPPLVWTVTHALDPQPVVVRPSVQEPEPVRHAAAWPARRHADEVRRPEPARRAEPPREPEPDDGSRHITWLVGGPSTVRRRQTADDPSYGEQGR